MNRKKALKFLFKKIVFKVSIANSEISKSKPTKADFIFKHTKELLVQVYKYRCGNYNTCDRQAGLSNRTQNRIIFITKI